MARISIYYVLFALIPFNKIAGESRGFAFVAFSTIDEARLWLEKKKVDTRDHPANESLASILSAD